MLPRQQRLKRKSSEMNSPVVTYKLHRIHPDYQSYGVVYVRLPLCLPLIKEILFECGVIVTCETLRRWACEFGPLTRTVAQQEATTIGATAPQQPFHLSPTEAFQSFKVAIRRGGSITIHPFWRVFPVRTWTPFFGKASTEQNSEKLVSCPARLWEEQKCTRTKSATQPKFNGNPLL
jgi:hypothetical protein